MIAENQKTKEMHDDVVPYVGLTTAGMIVLMAAGVICYQTGLCPGYLNMENLDVHM